MGFKGAKAAGEGVINYLLINIMGPLDRDFGFWELFMW